MPFLHSAYKLIDIQSPSANAATMMAVLLVPKTRTDGMLIWWRFLVKLSKAEKNIQRDVTPLPPIEHLAGAKILSKINFTPYHHPIIDENTDDIENAAVIMAYGNGKWTPVWFRVRKVSSHGLVCSENRSYAAKKGRLRAVSRLCEAIGLAAWKRWSNN